MINRSIQICLVLLLAVFAGCKQKENRSQTNASSDQIENGLKDKLFTKADVDTVITPFAPARITRKVKQDAKGNLLIASYDEIVRYDGKSFSHLAKKEGLESWQAFDVLEDIKGNIWVASNQSGLYHIEAASGKINEFSAKDGLADMRNMCMFQDKDGNIWIGGSNGLTIYDGISLKSYVLTERSNDNNVSCMVQHPTGEIWVGTRGNTFIYDGLKFNKVKKDDGESFTNTWSIIQDRNGSIWIGGGDGLWRYDGTSFKQISKEFVICVYEDKNANIWTTSPEGILTKYNEGKEAIQIFKGAGPFLGISEDKEGSIWFGGGDGVWRYDGNSITYFTGKHKKD